MPKDNNLGKMRHSCAHILAQAVLEMFPEAKLGIGPAIENGFYYDFDLPRTLIPEDMPIVEKKMKKIIKQNYPFKKEVVDRKKAIEFMKKIKQQYKVDLLKEMDCQKVTFYRQGHFVDLCGGPHLKSTGKIGAFKLLSIAGAYWRGSEKNKMLQRIYGTCFATQKELDEYSRLKEEAEKRDHRKLSKELDLLVFSNLVGHGLPLFTPKGTIIWQEISKYSSQLRNEIGYKEVRTPQINKAELFKTSGHYDKYKDDMFRVTSNYSKEEYFLKPMSCPQHAQIYASQARSYKDLPFKVADLSYLYRDEKPGEILGLTRLRSFSQDDGHCFCTEDQIENEFSIILKAIKKAMKIYGMDYYIRLSLRDEKNKNQYIGDDRAWKKSQKILESLLRDEKIDNIKVEGEAAFYGPKMDLMAKDSLGREWQLSTIQLDFNMPKRFGLEYIGNDSKKHTPVLIHSAIVGSPDRFMGVLIEHYAGALPVWLSPVQVVIIPVSNKFSAYAKKVYSDLLENNIRAELNNKDETLGKRISESEKQKIPYMIVVGEKEQKSKNITIRKRNDKKLTTLSLKKFIENVKQEIETKK
jgi:threonyl-tRNA synthetase